jgi:uncharacterized membrane protein (DUF373 family)
MVKERVSQHASSDGEPAARRRRAGDEEQRTRDKATKAFGYVEDGFYVLVALALGIAGVVLFGNTIYGFVDHLGQGSLASNVLELLDGLLLVFIVTELIHTVRAVIEKRVIMAEPFLVVGIVAGIRRLIVVSAEAKDLLGTPDFPQALLEMGVLTGAVILLTVAVFLLRHTTHSEPRSAHEPGDAVEG